MNYELTTGAYVGFGFISAVGLLILGIAFMRRNVGLIAGVVTAFVVPGFVLFGWPSGDGSGSSEEETGVAAVQIEELPEVKTLEEEPEPVDTEGEEVEPVEFAPPMQADVPSTVAVATFVQKLQPPPPPSTPTNRSQLTIPVHRAPPVSKIGNLIDLKDLDQKPIQTLTVEANYPYEMKRQGIEGEVVLGFIVDSRGNPLDIYVVRSTHAEFEQPAIQALQKWKFRPGKKGGKAVNTKNVRLPMKFSLNDS